MIIILHKINPFAGNGVGNNDARLVADGTRHTSRVNNTFYIMTIDLLHMPAKAFPFAAQILERHNLVGWPIDLNVITVDKDNQLR